MASKQRTYKITEIIEETPNVKSFIFDFEKSAQPGQFLMAWVPDFEEIPMSVSYCSDNKIGISVYAVGETTKKLHEMKEGDYVGLRGPYGTSFEPKGDKIAVIGGGCGSAPLGYLVESFFDENVEVHALLGAGTRENLLFKDRLEKLPYTDIHCATDDGSYGHEGFITEVFETLTEKHKFDRVYTCGPEIMMKKIYDTCREKKIDLQASLERYMKCGLGICGSCAIDGYLVCKDGPVFGMKDLNRMSEFGKKRRDRSGCHVEL